MPAPERRREKSGMALVIVLGVLSVMLIMAMSFTIIMRTERTASANRIDDMRLRHMLETALARAAAHIAADLVDENTNRLVYPPWLVLPSPTNSFTNYGSIGLFPEDFTNPVTATFPIDTYNNIQKKWNTTWYVNNGLVYRVPNPFPNKYRPNFRNDMTNYVPGALRAEAEINNTNMYWQPVSFVNTIGAYLGNVQSSMTVTTVVGRVAYMVLNCSGLWDANYVGGLSNSIAPYLRQSGANVREVDLNSFSPEITNATQFLLQRAGDVRYDSVHDLVENNLGNSPSNLFVYSYARTGYWDSASSCVTGALYLGTDADIAGAKSQVVEAFNKCGLSVAQSGWAYTNLMAYFNPYPFVTEICIENFITFTPSPVKYVLNTEVFLELWWPYPSETWDPASNKVNVAVTFLDGNEGRRPDNYTMTENAVTVNPDSPFKYITIKWSKDCGPASPNYNRARIDYQIFSPRSGLPVFNNSVVVNLAGSWAGDSPRHGSMEVVDPRFAGDPAWWRNRAGLSTNVNQAKGDFRANPANAAIVDDWDDWDGIGCSTTNRLLTLGELGFIAYAPWQTINLTNSNHAKVFDVFRLDQQTNYHGLFNPNSSNRDALASAFANMPVDYYAGQPVAAGKRLDLVKARLIADNIIANGPYNTNMSDLAKRVMWTNSAFSSICTDKPTREALIRNSFGLFNVRQNVFEILLAAEAAGVDGRFALRPVRSRAVAIVWRDPYTGRMFLRSIKYLRD